MPEFGIIACITELCKSQFSNFGKQTFACLCLLVVCIKLWQSAGGWTCPVCERDYYKPATHYHQTVIARFLGETALLSFRQGGELRRRIFLVKCVCLSPKGESAFYMKRQDSNSLDVFAQQCCLSQKPGNVQPFWFRIVYVINCF